MIKIFLPNNNINERKYIIDIIFYEFLGLDYEIGIDDSILDWEIELENNKKLIIKDYFFSKFLKDLEYLKLENIPQKVDFTKNQFIIENDIPLIYGDITLEVNSEKIVCGIDIFASSFFMLSRFEEYVNKNRDYHNRFSAYESVAFKNDFLDRPVVNEYIEMLKNMLLYLDENIEYKKHKYELFLTHDVDEIYMWKSWKHVLRVSLGDIIKRKSLTLAFERIAQYFLIKRCNIKDPFDTFDWLMDKSESLGLKSRFYFMSGGVTKYDNRYKIDEPKSLEIIEKIKEREHIIGFHPSYNAYNNFEQFRKEKEHLEQATNVKIYEGREHYLRFEVPTTWQIWEDRGMKVDSTCCYADKEGFRCGTGDEFSVFNILTRKKLNLKERPLVFMDDNHHTYSDSSSTSNSIQTLKNMLELSFEYKMKMTILFHNSIFYSSSCVDFIEFYESTILNVKRNLNE